MRSVSFFAFCFCNFSYYMDSWNEREMTSN